eukprot:150160-Amphidinium_carterae.2
MHHFIQAHEAKRRRLNDDSASSCQVNGSSEGSFRSSEIDESSETSSTARDAENQEREVVRPTQQTRVETPAERAVRATSYANQFGQAKVPCACRTKGSANCDKEAS